MSQLSLSWHHTTATVQYSTWTTCNNDALPHPLNTKHWYHQNRQGVSGNDSRATAMRPLFESTRVADVADIRVRANQYRSAFEPEEYRLTPLIAAAIFGRNRVMDALLADASVKVMEVLLPCLPPTRWGDLFAARERCHEHGNALCFSFWEMRVRRSDTQMNQTKCAKETGGFFVPLAGVFFFRSWGAEFIALRLP